MKPFIGRRHELKVLKNQASKRLASLIVIKGRRRVGKTRLLEEFAKAFDAVYSFSGIAPTPQTTRQLQHQEFVRQFVRQLKFQPEQLNDWGDLFWELSKKTESGRVLIILDEISWMGSKDPEFLSKLKNIWDTYFNKNDQLILVLCGSVSSWIEKNILSSTAFLGRVSLNLTLKELPINDCVEFWGEEKDRVSAHEKLKTLAVTGGIPRYLENIDPKLPAELNIQQLCFTQYGALFEEFEKIFSDLFSNRSQSYKEIINCLTRHSVDQAEILKQLKMEKGGVISEYLDDLVQSGFVSRDYTWSIKNQNISKLSHYRLSDNYSRFYLHYILPNKQKIESGRIEGLNLSGLPNWPVIMGLQVENLILNNRQLIIDALRINSSEIVCDNPFFQRKSARQKGCQIA
ncbi:MAG: ATP-binding protein [Coxiellaceae bacterium]|nr:ATP-binding protein [Coxiellaceae bacterium]